jgi:hypothetical protein
VDKYLPHFKHISHLLLGQVVAQAQRAQFLPESLH